MASKAYSDLDDSYSDYSDDFDDSRPSSPLRKNKYASGNKRKVSTTQSDSEADDTTSYDSRPTMTKGNLKKTYRKSTKNSWKGASATSSMKRKTSNMKTDPLHSRMYSAQRNRINSLNNELGECKIKFEQLVKENRLLRTLQQRQEKSLKKFQDVEGDLPRMISQHMDDQRILKVRLRKSQEAERATEGKLKDRNEEIHKMENTLRRLKKIVYDKNLGERSELAKQLTLAEDKLFNEEKKSKELEKKLQLTTQSYSRQLRSEQIKHKECRFELQELKEKFSSMEFKLKEKERALDVSNIYSHRTKPSPEKTSASNRLSITARPEGKLSPRSIEPLMPLPLEEPEKSLDANDLFDEKPSSGVLHATGDVTDYRKTIKSPIKPPSSRERRKSSDLPSTSGKEADKAKSQNDNEADQRLHPEKESTRGNRSVFLTSNYSPNTTFISETSFKSPAPPEVKPPTLSPPSPKLKQEAEPELVKRKTEKELKEEKRKLEEERRKKADLLARMKDLENEEKVSSLPQSRKSGGDDLLSFLNKDSTPAKKSIFRPEKNPKTRVVEEYEEIASHVAVLDRRLSRNLSFTSNYDHVATPEYPVDNLHKGIPTFEAKTKSSDDEPEITFGSYAPSVAVPTKRKPHNQPAKQSSPSGSESDEPLLDLDSGKQKKADFLQQLFGNDPSDPNASNTPSHNPTPSSRNSYAAKTTPRAKPLHSGYPWEKNVLPASSLHAGNGDTLSTSHRKDDLRSSPAVKPLSTYLEDDVEELVL